MKIWKYNILHLNLIMQIVSYFQKNFVYILRGKNNTKYIVFSKSTRSNKSKINKLIYIQILTRLIRKKKERKEIYLTNLINEFQEL